MKDHFKEVNCDYFHIFAIIETQKTRISYLTLTMGQLDDWTVADYRWLSQHLLAFIAKNIDNDLHGRRMALTQNVADNGFELWRALFVENDWGPNILHWAGCQTIMRFLNVLELMISSIGWVNGR